MPWLNGPEPQRRRILREAELTLQESPRGVVFHLSGGQSISVKCLRKLVPHSILAHNYLCLVCDSAIRALALRY